MSHYRPGPPGQPPPPPGYDTYAPSYSSYPPPPPPSWSDSRPSSDRYFPDQQQSERGSGFRGPYSDLRRQPNQQFSRDHRDDFRPPQGDFNFRVERPAGVQDRDTYAPYRPSDRADYNDDRNGRGDRDIRGDRSYRPQRQDNGRSGPPANRNNRGGYQGTNSRRGGQPRWVPPKAADRQLLHRKHDENVEVMLGDTTNRVTYRAVEDLSDDDEAAMEISGASESDEAAEPATKRARLSNNNEGASDGQSIPKWSNPDPYTALPPPDETQRKKVDVVQLIRKARVDPDSKPAVSKEVAEFISCDFTDDEDDNHLTSLSGPSVPNAPRGPRAGPSSLPPRPPVPRSETRDSGRGGTQIPAPIPAKNSTTLPSPAAQTLSNGGKKTVDLQPSTSLGNRKRTHDDQIKLPHARLPKVTRMGTAGAIVPVWRVESGEDPCPWAETDHSTTPVPAVRLHKELVDFHEFVRPRDFEDRVRQEMVDKLDTLIKRQWSDATVLPFGSFRSGLYLPTADMDLVICSKSFLNGGRAVLDGKRRIFDLMRFFERHRVAYPNEFEPITRAKVPLLKYCDSGTGLKVDISFEKLDGVQAVETFMKWKDMYPAMPILVSVIKHFLCMRGLNEPVNGGIGGFSVICLVVNLLNMLPEVQSRSMVPEHHLGQLLLAFFKHYGFDFHYNALAIRMDPIGEVNKNELSDIVYRNMDRLSIIDPRNPSNDISGGSSNWPAIAQQFADAYTVLVRRMAELAKVDREVHGYNTILAPLFAGNYSSFRIQREYMEKVDTSGLPSMLNKSSYWERMAW